ncbi:PfkB family carbohydrate kinase [Nocardioides sp. SYSU DS0651]|uniref:PfkB family carbohydrate kinase n=1 Tax=Nocardioides sp. SYSU DS0651 TaxID=3415955 RepID=UPI003F4C1895
MTGPLVVVGDALLDVDVRGSAERLAPDAPVPVVDVAGQSERPGGAGLAAVLAARLAGDRREVVLVAPLADDEAGQRLRDLLAEAGVTVVALPHSGRTTVKRRVLAQDGRPLLRLDEGGGACAGPLPADAARALAAADAVLVADYGQGTTASPEVRDALAGVRGRMVWDPHPRGAAPVAGVDLATPNDKEATAFGAGVEGTGLRAVATRADLLRERWQARAVTVTLGSRGALLSAGGPPSVVPPPPGGAAGPVDPCGAGDCFAGAAALALADGALVSEAVERAVAAASAFVRSGGVHGSAEEEAVRAAGAATGLDAARAVATRVGQGGGTVVATGGCFDLLHAGHVATLRAARALGDCLVVLVNSDASVRRLKGPSRPVVPEADRVQVLAALDCVDAVVLFDDDTPIPTLEELQPAVWAKGGDYSGTALPEAPVLERWGGVAVVLPYLEGRSTTGIVSRVAAAVG